MKDGLEGETPRPESLEGGHSGEKEARFRATTAAGRKVRIWDFVGRVGRAGRQ